MFVGPWLPTMVVRVRPQHVSGIHVIFAVVPNNFLSEFGGSDKLARHPKCHKPSRHGKASECQCCGSRACVGCARRDTTSHDGDQQRNVGGACSAGLQCGCPDFWNERQGPYGDTRMHRANCRSSDHGRPGARNASDCGTRGNNCAVGGQGFCVRASQGGPLT